MRRDAKPAKAKAEASPPVARKSRNNESAREADLEKRLAEAQKREAGALEQQAATAEILRVISSSLTDVQPVFEAIADSTMHLFEALGVAVVRYDGELISMAAARGGAPGSAVAATERFRVPHPPIAGFPPEQTVLTKTMHHVADVNTDPSCSDEFRRHACERGFRSVLSMPMLRGGDPVGVIVVSRAAPRPFSDSQIALLQTFADQAVIAIENVRLFTELQEKNRALTQAHAQVSETLDQQTATSEILRVIASSPTDERPVFETIVESALRLLCGHTAGVRILRGSDLHISAFTSTTASGDAALAEGPVTVVPVSSSPHFTRVVQDRTPSVVEDTESDVGLLPPGARQVARVRGYRSVLTVPLLRGETVLGLINVTHRAPGPFTSDDIALLQTFADQAVIAIENVRLFTELQAKNQALAQAHAQVSEALEQQTATSEILRVISSSPTDLQPVLDAVAESAARLCEAQDATIRLVDGNGLQARAHFGPIALPPRIPMARGSVAGRAVIDRETVHLHDLQAPENESEFPYGHNRWQEVRTLLATPLLREGAAIGVIVIRRTEVRPFSDKHIALLKTFADQAVIAIENVRLFTELQDKNRALTEAHTQVTEALERQTATAEILRIISRSQTDVQPVFDTIADSAIRLLQGWSALILLYDGKLLHLAAARGGLPDSERLQRARFPMLLRPDHLLARCIVERAPQQDPDALAHPTLGYVARGRGFAAFLTVPMLRGGEAIGVVVVTRATPGPFDESAVALLQTFADQAVIAIENARLLSELQARTHALTRSVNELTALGDVSRALSSTLDLEIVLQTIVTRANQLAGTAGCTIWEYDESREEFRLRVSHYADERDRAMLQTPDRVTTIRKGQGVTTRVVELRCPVQIPDITAPGAYESPIRQALIDAGHRALLGVPLLREDQVIGVLAVTRKEPGEFTAEVIELLTTFATQSALAIQNARLFREIADKSRQLEAASRHKSEFLANMSHELRTPLNAIIGFSEVLTERMFGELNEKQEEYLKDIYASGQHLLSLINDILDLSKIEAGRMELELTDFDLSQAIDNALMLVRDRAARRGITLNREVDQRLGQIRSDERKVKQVLLNLLSNALKFTPEGGRVEVRATIVNGLAEIAVTDTGVGIAPEDQEAVFEEFRQVGTADKKVEGTGLGLTLSRKFIELHGGRIWVKSQVGMGSTFTFTLPLTI